MFPFPAQIQAVFVLQAVCFTYFLASTYLHPQFFATIYLGIFLLLSTTKIQESTKILHLHWDRIFTFMRKECTVKIWSWKAAAGSKLKHLIYKFQQNIAKPCFASWSCCLGQGQWTMGNQCSLGSYRIQWCTFLGNCKPKKNDPHHAIWSIYQLDDINRRDRISGNLQHTWSFLLLQLNSKKIPFKSFKNIKYSSS